MAQGTCALCGAHKKLIARGLCSACYQRAAARGERDGHSRVKLSFEESLALAKAAETDEGCWPWPQVSSTGYPLVARGRSRAYRVMYEREFGPVPHGLTLDHLCHSRTECSSGPRCPHRRCVRPDHLEPVTPLEQQRRRPDRHAPTCRNKHVRTDKNTRYFTDSRGYVLRRCLDCQRDRHYEYLARRAETL